MVWRPPEWSAAGGAEAGGLLRWESRTTTAGIPIGPKATEGWACCQTGSGLLLLLLLLLLGGMGRELYIIRGRWRLGDDKRSNIELRQEVNESKYSHVLKTMAIVFACLSQSF